jgi:hypothetical protein
VSKKGVASWPRPRELPEAELTAGVLTYVESCRDAKERGIRLSPKYHPTVDGVLKAVFTIGEAEEEFVEDLFRLIAGLPPRVKGEAQ